MRKLFLTVALGFVLAASAAVAATSWRPGYEQNTGCAAAVAATDNGPAQSDGNGHCVRVVLARLPTYVATGSGFVSYATPTDMFCLWGSATKTVYVTGFWIGPHSTAVTGMVWFFYKRSTVDTGGTPTNVTGIPFDSADPAATATATLYGSSPTLGTTVGLLNNYNGSTVALTGNSTAVGLDSNAQILYADKAQPVTYRKPAVLHGVGEGVCLNLGGAALPGGFTSFYRIEWTEF